MYQFFGSFGHFRLIFLLSSCLPRHLDLIWDTGSCQTLLDFNQLWEGSNGIEFARYILEHAQNLEKNVIVHLPQHSDVERELSKSKMISNATLVLRSVPNCGVFP